MISTAQKHLSREAFIGAIQQSKECLEVLQNLEVAKGQQEKCPPMSSLIATYLVSDLYSEHSNNEANINRITTNLEAAADDLLMISKLIRSLR